MAQSSFPFENIDTTETQYSQMFRTLNNGVNGTPDGGELEVDAAGVGLAVDVAAGQAMVRGHFYISTDTETRALSVADPADDRIDTIVLRLDPVANTVLLAVKTGTPDAAPVAPALVQTDGGVFEQPLANVLVPANAGTPGTITDRREFMGTKLGTWTTTGRPVPAGRVLFGYNTTLELVEYYDPVAEDWEPVATTIDELNDIGDVDITTPADGDLLVYDDGDWVNQALATDQMPTGSVIAVKDAIFTGIQDASVAASANVAVTNLSITHTMQNASNKLIISAYFGAAGSSEGKAQVGIAVADDGTLIGIGDAAGVRTRTGAAGGPTSATSGVFVVATPSVMFVYAPGDTASHTFTVRAINVEAVTRTLFINRMESDIDDAGRPRAASALVIQEVAV
jgi:hypothetical protein